MKDFIEADKEGNVLSCVNEMFYLELVKEGSRKRKIGYFKTDSKGNPWYIKEGLVEQEHMFGTRSNKYPLSWGLHEALIRKLPEDTNIGLKTDVKKYVVSATDALNTKFFRFFKNEGFELQVFVPLDTWRHIEYK